MPRLSSRLVDKAGTLQSVLFHRSIWSVREAKALLRRHGRRVAGHDKASKGGYHRFRIRPVSKFRRGSLRTVTTQYAGVKAVVGEPRVSNPKRNRARGLAELVNDFLARRFLCTSIPFRSISTPHPTGGYPARA